MEDQPLTFRIDDFRVLSYSGPIHPNHPRWELPEGIRGITLSWLADTPLADRAETLFRFLIEHLNLECKRIVVDLLWEIDQKDPIFGMGQVVPTEYDPADPLSQVRFSSGPPDPKVVSVLAPSLEDVIFEVVRDADNFQIGAFLLTIDERLVVDFAQDEADLEAYCRRTGWEDLGLARLAALVEPEPPRRSATRLHSDFDWSRHWRHILIAPLTPVLLIPSARFGLDFPEGICGLAMGFRKPGHRGWSDRGELLFKALGADLDLDWNRLVFETYERPWNEPPARDWTPIKGPSPESPNPVDRLRWQFSEERPLTTYAVSSLEALLSGAFRWGGAFTERPGWVVVDDRLVVERSRPGQFLEVWFACQDWGPMNCQRLLGLYSRRMDPADLYLPSRPPSSGFFGRISSWFSRFRSGSQWVSRTPKPVDRGDQAPFARSDAVEAPTPFRKVRLFIQPVVERAPPPNDDLLLPRGARGLSFGLLRPVEDGVGRLRAILTAFLEPLNLSTERVVVDFTSGLGHGPEFEKELRHPLLPFDPVDPLTFCRFRSEPALEVYTAQYPSLDALFDAVEDNGWENDFLGGLCGLFLDERLVIPWIGPDGVGLAFYLAADEEALGIPSLMERAEIREPWLRREGRAEE